jgi:hypothetical protein
VNEDVIKCDGCPKVLQADEALICLDDHSTRLALGASPYVFCASCYAAHRIAWEMLPGAAHAHDGGVS